MKEWSEKSLYRPGLPVSAGYALRELVVNFRNSAAALAFLFSLMFVDIREFCKGLYEFSAAPYFAHRCRLFGAEHVHVHFASRSLTLGIFISILNGIPLSCTVHAFDIFTRGKASLAYRLGKCSFIASISHYNVKYLRQICGDGIADRCRIVRCGIDTRRFECAGDKKRGNTLLCVANLVEKKGHETAIRACSLLKSRGVDFRLHIVGDGELRGRLERLVEECDLAANVILHGHVPNDRLEEFYSEADVFVMPCLTDRFGDRDGIPVAFMEALACRVPVISTWVSGIPELVRHDESGLLVPERSIDGLAEAIETLLKDPQRARRMGERGREIVAREFEIEKTSSILRGYIESAGELSRRQDAVDPSA